MSTLPANLVPGLPDAWVRRVTHRRGREVLYPSIDPRRCALLVIDMQNVFVDARWPSAVPAAAAIMDTINAVAAQLRACGGLVCFTRHTADAGWDRYVEVLGRGDARSVEKLLGCGADGHGVHPALHVAPADAVLDKTRFSALNAGGCALHDLLRDRSIDTLAIAGTLTNVCCESTARDAMELGYRTLVLADATAARSAAIQRASLLNVYSALGDVTDAAGFVSRLRPCNRGIRLS